MPVPYYIKTMEQQIEAIKTLKVHSEVYFSQSSTDSVCELLLVRDTHNFSMAKVIVSLALAKLDVQFAQAEGNMSQNQHVQMLTAENNHWNDFLKLCLF